MSFRWPVLPLRRLVRSLRSGLALLAVLLPLAAAADEFVPGLEDLPLMPGLAPVRSAAPVKFDSPGGRIVIAFAEGAVQADHVVAFYASTLPQLGWVRIDAVQFRREGETLALEFGRGARGLTVRFTLSPS